MIKIGKDTYVDVEKYDERIRRNGYIVYDLIKMETILRYEQARVYTLSSLAIDVMAHKSGLLFASTDRTLVKRYLQEVERCPAHYFKKRGVQAESIDMKKVLRPLYENGYANEFLHYYMEYSSLNAKCNKIKNIVSTYRFPMGINEYNTPVYKLTYDVNVQQNLRYNYKSCDIVGIPKYYNNCITVEKGYFLAWGDFAQSDFRIAYNLLMRNETDAELMEIIEDKYEGIARLVSKYLSKEFDVSQFKDERDLYKTLVLATVYGTGTSVIEKEKEFIFKFTQFLNTCAKYVEYKKRIKLRIKLGLPLKIRSYFGHEEIISIEGNETEIMYKALNTPIQSGTSEIIIIIANMLLDRFYDIGYTEDDISIYYTRHDEPIFKCRHTIIKDLWIFNDFKEILVDDWMPLGLTFDYGYVYKVQDEELTKQAIENYKANEHRLGIYEKGHDIDTEYYPMDATYLLDIHSIDIPEADKTVVAFYHRETNSVSYKLVNSIIYSEVCEFIGSTIRELEPSIVDKGYAGILASSIEENSILSEDFVNDRTYVRYVRDGSVDMYNVACLCRFMVSKFCKREGYAVPCSLPLESDREFIESVNIIK